MRSKYTLPLIVILLLGAFAARIADLHATPPGINYDAEYNLVHGLRISQGYPLPALWFDDRSEPAHRYVIAAWFKLVGASQFTGLLLHGLIGLLTVALAFRAGRILAGDSAGLVAAGAIAASMPYLFLSRSTYRASLLSPLLLAAIIAFLYASRHKNRRSWLLGGIFTGASLNVYLAGMVAPGWLLGILVHGHIFAKRERRIHWRDSAAALAGFLPFAALWWFTMTQISDPFFRILGASSDKSADAPVQEQIFSGTLEAITAFYRDAYHEMTLYNMPNSPFLNPVFAAFALIGVLLALRYWRRIEGVMLLGGVFLFILPAALSSSATHPVRLMGTLPFLALLAGWGASGLLTLVQNWRPNIRWQPAINGLLLGVVLISTGITYTRYWDFFNDRDGAAYAEPLDWRSIPHNYSIQWVEAVEWLRDVDKPTYVPLNVLDDRIATFLLFIDGYEVTTAARYGLTDLPTGQIFYPDRALYSVETPESYPLQGLLLPDEKLIVILPAAAGSLDKQMPESEAIVSAEWGWTLGYRTPYAPQPLPPAPVVDPTAPILGGGLQLTNPYTVDSVEPLEQVTVILEWAVTDTIGRDVFTYVQPLDPVERIAYGSSDRQVLPLLYPSVMWQPGDIIPDLHTLALAGLLPHQAYRWTAGAWVSPPRRTDLQVRGANGDYLGEQIIWGAGRTTPPDLTPPPDLMQRVDAQLGDSMLLEGYTLEKSGEALTLTLYWQAIKPMPQEYTVFVHLMQGESFVAQSDVQPSPPTWSWFADEQIRTVHTLTVPEGSTPDALYVGMYTFPGPTRAPITLDGEQLPDDRILLATEFD